MNERSQGQKGIRMDFVYGPDMDRWYSEMTTSGQEERTTVYAGNYERLRSMACLWDWLPVVAGICNIETIGADFIHGSGKMFKINFKGRNHIK